jgi:hypothetical protein
MRAPRRRADAGPPLQVVRGGLEIGDRIDEVVENETVHRSVGPLTLRAAPRDAPLRDRGQQSVAFAR